MILWKFILCKDCFNKFFEINFSLKLVFGNLIYSECNLLFLNKILIYVLKNYKCNLC